MAPRHLASISGQRVLTGRAGKGSVLALPRSRVTQAGSCHEDRRTGCPGRRREPRRRPRVAEHWPGCSTGRGDFGWETIHRHAPACGRGRRVPGDPGDAARLAQSAGRPQVELQLFRCRARRGRHKDRGQPAAGAEGERDLREDDRRPAPGGPRPAADRQRAAPATGADRVLAALRHRPAAPCPRQLTPAPAGTSPPEPVNLAQYWIRRKQVLSGPTYEYYVAS
jgi:hypothetical protein